MRRHGIGTFHASLAAGVVSLLAFGAGTAAAQNWSFDARTIGMGSPAGEANLATRMIQDARPYRTIVLPFGLIQVLRDFDRLDPSSDDFDLVRAVEYGASPVHYTFGRERGDSKADDFIVDIGNGELNRDLNVYKGFIPVNQPPAGGVAAPSWGKTFRFRASEDGAFQGVYAGAGPYISMRTAPVIDPRLIQILGSGPPVYIPNAQLTMQDTTQGQMALAVTGGYRARLAWPEGTGLGLPARVRVRRL
jgi:hypothetical protein